jgi:hypothetical protein
MRRLLPVAVTSVLIALAGHAWAQDDHGPAIAPANASSPPIGPSSAITPADLEAINAQIRNDEVRLTHKRDAELARENGVIANTRVVLNFNPYPHPRRQNFARLFGWRKAKQTAPD